MMDEEEQGLPGHRLVRQRYEEACGAIRVALDALRDVYPIDREVLGGCAGEWLRALEEVTGAYEALDDISKGILGEIMHDVLIGVITTHEQLDRHGVSRYDGEEAPAL